MAIKTTLEQIEEVQAAITAVMSGQSFMIGGKQLTKANLANLNERETMLLARYQREAGRGAVVNVGTLRRD
jgi:hypothetical protein